MIPSGKSEVTVTESLSLAFQKSQDCGLAPIWVAEEEVKNLTPTKTDVFVLDPFEGPAFDHVTSNVKFKCTIVGKYQSHFSAVPTLVILPSGPMCLLACLTQNIPVPEFNYPLYTAAMLGLVVTCSGLDKSQKVSGSWSG